MPDVWAGKRRSAARGAPSSRTPTRAFISRPNARETYGSPSTLRLNKIDCARSQLLTAIQLFFEDRDPISIHTLTSAAYDILHDIGRPRGLEPIFKGARFLPREQRDAYKDLLNRPRNFFKHADLDPHVRLIFDPDVTLFLLFDACDFYARLMNERPPEMNLLRTYFHAQYPDLVADPALRRDLEDLQREADLRTKSAWLALLQPAQPAS